MYLTGGWTESSQGASAVDLHNQQAKTLYNLMELVLLAHGSSLKLCDLMHNTRCYVLHVHCKHQVAVLGKGFREKLEIPAEIDADVEFHSRLPYPEFWGRIATSYALVPAFGMPVYYESRISSTILASLVTSAPVVAEQRLLDTYTFLTEEHVFLRKPGEDEVSCQDFNCKL